MLPFEKETVVFKFIYFVILFLLIVFLTAIFLTAAPEILQFIHWLVGEKEPQLVIGTFLLVAVTVWLVLETRKVGEIDRQPWLFIDAFSINEQLACVLKNTGKIPVRYEILNYKVQVDGIELAKPSFLHNSGGEIYQEQTQEFLLGVIANMPAIYKEAQDNLSNQKPPRLINGSIEILLHYSTIDGRHTKSISKKYAIEMRPLFKQNLSVYYVENFSFRWFEST